MPPVITKQAIIAANQYAAATAAITRIDSQTAEAIAALQAKAQQQKQKHATTAANALSVLQAYAANTPAIFAGAKKATIGPVIVGYRKAPDTIALLPGQTEDTVIEKLKKYCQVGLTYVTRLDKNALKKQPETLLNKCGLHTAQGTDKFYIETQK